MAGLTLLTLATIVNIVHIVTGITFFRRVFIFIADMADIAVNFLMLANQIKIGIFLMIEFYFLPGFCVVTASALLAEIAFMRIFFTMTVDAFAGCFMVLFFR